MKTTTILATTLALASSTIAAPTRSTIQQQIQTLEIQIVKVVNDIVQSSSDLKSDYETGIKQFGALSNELDGPLPCAPFVPSHPSTKKAAIKALQSSQEGLMQLSLDLEDMGNKIKAGDLHPDVCVALDYYAAVSDFVGN